MNEITLCQALFVKWLFLKEISLDELANQYYDRYKSYPFNNAEIRSQFKNGRNLVFESVNKLNDNYIK